jgi:hypothetical protein
MNIRFGLAGTLLLSLIGFAAPAHADQCIAVASVTSGGVTGGTTGCNLLITLNSGNIAVITHLNNGAAGSSNPNTLDGSDDTLVGIQNNSGGTVFNIHLTSNADIFGFDNTLGSLDNNYLPLLNPGTACTGGVCYQGPNTTFSNIVNVFDGVVNFTGGLANGGTAYFALEGDLSNATFTT